MTITDPSKTITDPYKCFDKRYLSNGLIGRFSKTWETSNVYSSQKWGIMQFRFLIDIVSTWIIEYVQWIIVYLQFYNELNFLRKFRAISKYNSREIFVNNLACIRNKLIEIVARQEYANWFSEKMKKDASVFNMFCGQIRPTFLYVKAWIRKIMAYGNPQRNGIWKKKILRYFWVNLFMTKSDSVVWIYRFYCH